MALKLVVTPVEKAPEGPKGVQFTTKYGQLACRICRKEPPLGYSGVCYTCKQKENI